MPLPPSFSIHILTVVHLSLLLSSPFFTSDEPEKPMEKTSLGILSRFLSLFLSYATINQWKNQCKFFWSFPCLLGLNIELLACSFKIHRKQQKRNTCSPAKGDLELSTEDVEMVMQRMGISYSQEGRWLEEYMACDELYSMFEKREPSLEEVKEAFHVFDSNRDGFIDSMELQKAISNLGYREGLSLEACKQMITAHDENLDGQMDFIEFVKLMENSFC